MKPEDRKLLTAVDMADLTMTNVVQMLKDREDPRWIPLARLQAEFCTPLLQELVKEGPLTLNTVVKVEIEKKIPADQDVRVKDDLNEAIDKAAECLPEGWQIELSVERGSASVTLIRPDGSVIPIEDDEGMVSMVRSAILCADAEVRADGPSKVKVENKITTAELMALPEGSQLTAGTRLWFGVHRTHCCTKHGCKYGREDCPVVKGRIDQSGPCEQCGLEESGYYDDDRDRVELRKVRKKLKELEAAREEDRQESERNFKFLMRINDLLGRPFVNVGRPTNDAVLKILADAMKEKLASRPDNDGHP